MINKKFINAPCQYLVKSDIFELFSGCIIYAFYSIYAFTRKEYTVKLPRYALELSDSVIPFG